jgi:hypothetical protein
MQVDFIEVQEEFTAKVRAHAERCKAIGWNLEDTLESLSNMIKHIFNE